MVRYANPAVRFQPAEPIQEKWETPKIADTFGSICPQANVGDIDCLFLQIYVPEKHFKNGDGSSKLPVMVFIHGGGFIFGDGNSYGPEYFMENEDVILVTVNYRLGIFGDTGDDTIKANIGLKDQIMALGFVKENAAAFNGDDSNIIIFGESAGSSSVHYLLMTPAAEGYFDKAILQSGVMSFWAFDPNPPRQTALKFVKESLHCENVKDDAKPKEQSLQIKECLEKAETAQLAMNQLTFWPRWPRANPCSRFMPTADWEGGKTNDSFFASRPHFSQSGKKNVYYSKVPVIIGTTSDEGATAFGASAYESEESLQELTNEWNKIAPITFSYDIHFPVENLAEISQKIKKFYFGSEPITLENKQALADLYSDTWFLLPSISVAGELARNGVSVYPYIFSYWGSWTARSIFTQRTDDVYEGLAGHADDIQYLFPGSMLSSHLKPGSEQEEFSRNFVNLWTSFAKQGSVSYFPFRVVETYSTPESFK
ncbi:Esterase E4 [Orchesella cincta]|uniref:Esterase E4 n=1 Tax=Orchesella cincta TaxID=48709 RepID=A0A1D2MVN1_ORCCI|nr:Esterase E4 [Orchesella cincta]